MNQPKIELYRIRDFGSKLNATTEYIRQNLGSLLKVVLLLVCPLALITAILFSNQYSMFSGMMSGNHVNMAEPEAMGLFSSMMSNYFYMMLVYTISMAFLFTTVYTYMKLKDETGVNPSVGEVYSKIWSKLPVLLLLLFVNSIIIFIGFMLFFIPGLYLSIVLSISVPILLFEKCDFGTALSKSFKLIKGKWWSTFGLLFISMLIAVVISYIFAIPFYAIAFGSMFSTNIENDPSSFFSNFTSWYSVVGITIMMIGSYLTYIIPTIALSFQYFNLSERHEGRGLKEQINEFEAVA